MNEWIDSRLDRWVDVGWIEGWIELPEMVCLQVFSHSASLSMVLNHD